MFLDFQTSKTQNEKSLTSGNGKRGKFIFSYGKAGTIMSGNSDIIPRSSVQV